MNSETRQKSASNSGSSSVKSDQSINYQTAEYGHFFWATYFHQLNQQSMVNLSTQERPQDNLNLTQPLTQGSHYSPISSSSSSSSPLASLSSNMKDLCRYNPSNSFKNGKNPQIDNNSSNCRPNYDDWNSRDDINRYTTNGVRSNQYSISENSDGDCPQKLALDENRYKKEMAAVIEQIQRRAEYQGYPIIHAKSPYKCPTREYTVVDEHRMDEIIAKELDLALSLSKKGRKNSRSHRLNQQTKQKTRPKTGKKSSIKDKLISITVERIKAAVFNCTPNLPSARANKKSDHGSNQQSTQNQSFHQPEAWNQYQEYHIPGQFQHPQLMCKPKPEVLRQPADPQPLTRKHKRYCTCKKRNGRVNNDVPSSSASVSNHFNVSSADFNSTNSIYGLHHR